MPTPLRSGALGDADEPRLALLLSCCMVLRRRGMVTLGITRTVFLAWWVTISSAPSWASVQVPAVPPGRWPRRSGAYSVPKPNACV